LSVSIAVYFFTVDGYLMVNEVVYIRSRWSVYVCVYSLGDMKWWVIMIDFTCRHSSFFSFRFHTSTHSVLVTPVRSVTPRSHLETTHKITSDPPPRNTVPPTYPAVHHSTTPRLCAVVALLLSFYRRTIFPLLLLMRWRSRCQEIYW